MKYLLLIPLFLFGCESGTDNTTDIPTEECSTGDDTTDRASACCCLQKIPNSDRLKCLCWRTADGTGCVGCPKSCTPISNSPPPLS